MINALICQGLVFFESIDLAYLIDFSNCFATEMVALRELAAQGLVTLDSAGIALTDEGRYVAPAVAMVFDRYLQTDRLRTRYSKII